MDNGGWGTTTLDDQNARPAVLTAVVTGPKHQRAGTPGQDAVASATFGDTVIVALADGAGSYPRSHHGARLAVFNALSSLGYRRAAERSGELEADLRETLHEVRRSLGAVAEAAAVGDPSWTIKDLSCTLSIAIYGPEEVGVASVGDCVHVLRNADGELALVAMAPDTEVKNRTDFITRDELDSVIHTAVLPADRVDALLLSSDGLDLHLKGKVYDERWPLVPSVNALLDAPLLEGWGAERFESFMSSAVVRNWSDDDCSLAIIRAPVPRDATGAPAITLQGDTPLSSGRPARLVEGSAALVAAVIDPEVPADAQLRRRLGPAWNRVERHQPVLWPIRRHDERHVLHPRSSPRAANLREVLSGRHGHCDRRDLLTATKRCVDALEEAGVAHGRLNLDCFVVNPDGTVTLIDPGPGMFDGTDYDRHHISDRQFASGLEASPAADPPDGWTSIRTGDAAAAEPKAIPTRPQERSFATPSRPITRGGLLGRGADGAVYEVAGESGAVVKLFEATDGALQRRVEAMVEIAVPADVPGARALIAWPSEVVRDSQGTFVGFTMPAAPEPEPRGLSNLMQRSRRELFVRNLGFAALVTVCASYAAAIAHLHGYGVVVGDMSEANVLVSGDLRVTVIGCDSMTIRHNGRVHLTPFHKAEFLAPELRGVDLTKVPRSPEHDRHAFAMLLWMTLMGGYNPFQGVWKGSGDEPRAVENAAVGRFAWDPEREELAPPLDAPPFEVIPADLQQLFLCAFTVGACDPRQRPTAATWSSALADSASRLATCAGPRPHHYPAALDGCPWCVHDQRLEAPEPALAISEPEAPRQVAHSPIEPERSARISDDTPVAASEGRAWWRRRSRRKR